MLSQLSYIPWVTAYEPCLWRRLSGASLRVRRTHLRGRLTDLERPEEWERQDLEPRVLFCLFLHSNELLITDSHRELIRLPASNRCRSCAFGTATLRDSHGSSLILANLVTLVTASSDLTSLQTLSTKSIFEGPFIRGWIRRSSLKEVIQPHLPVRLPCYDFTPLTGHSFGASVPYGFGQRLREHQTRVM